MIWNSGNPMELTTLQSRLGVQLPPRHLEALQNLADPIHKACDFLLIESTCELLRLDYINDFLHAQDTIDPWPLFLVAFASNGCRDFYAYDLRHGMSVIYIDPDWTVAENLSAEDKLQFETFDQWYEWELSNRRR